MTRIMVTRPLDEAHDTAARLAACGHDVLIEPLLRIRETGAALPPGPFDAAVVTSGNAVRAVARRGPGPELLGLPVMAVGRRTAAAAERSGFTDVAFAGRDVEALVAALAARWTSPCRILYLAGTDHTVDLAARLAPAGHVVSVCPVYEALKSERFSTEAAAALAEGEIDAVLHYSARTAEAFVAASRGIVSRAGSDLLHLCLSRKVADILVASGARRVEAAALPEEDALLDLIPVSNIGLRDIADRPRPDEGT
jgi:uroporphyrinogen-III synthase